MKKILAIMLFALVGLSTSNYIQAQVKQYYSVGWDVGMPIGSFSDYIGNTSLQGGFFSGNVFISDPVSIGFKFGYNSFYENVDRQTYQLDASNASTSMAITAASYNYIVSAPMQIGVYYHLNAGQLEPYIGLGLGVNYITEETLIQDYDFYDSQWAFLLNPEVGLRYQFRESPFAVGLRAGYNYNINSFKIWGVEYTNFQSLNIGLSLSWTIQ